MFHPPRRFLNSEKSRIARRELKLAAVIIAILGGIFYQSYRLFDTAREQGRSTSCRSNLKQIGLAMLQYANDYDDTLPRAWFGKDAGPSNAKTNYKWMDAIFPYAKKEGLFNCPSDRVSKPYRFRSGASYGSYVFNNAYFAPGDKFTPPPGRKLSEIHPSYTVLVMDGENAFQFGWPNATTAPRAGKTMAPFALDTVGLRHGPGETPNTLWSSGFAQSYSMWQNCAPKTINGQEILTGLTIEED